LGERDLLSTVLNAAFSKVILNVAKTVAERGDISFARTLIAHAWITAAWYEPLPALSVADPILLSEIVAAEAPRDGANPHT